MVTSTTTATYTSAFRIARPVSTGASQPPNSMFNVIYYNANITYIIIHNIALTTAGLLAFYNLLYLYPIYVLFIF